MALTIPKSIQLDLSKTGSQASFNARKGDNSVYVARISLIDRGTVIAIPDTCTALLHGIKPDGYPLYTDATINGGRVIAEFPEQAFTSVGTVQFEVNVVGADGETLYSPKFDVLVEDVVSEGSTESTADFSALQTALILARRGIVIQGSPYATIELLKADITDPRIGDIYEVGTTIPYDKWRWSGNTATGDDGWIPEGTMSGKSAFQLAVDGGYTGTLEQWIESLRGNDGHGVPSGGSVNQTLVKSGAEDFATSWGNAMLQYAAMPTATVSNLGQIAQFTGSTGDGYTNGHIYTCVSSGGETPTYSWTEIVYGDPNSVSYNAQTGKTSAEKAQARANIGAASGTTPTATLPTTGWAGSGPYTYEATVAGVTADNALIVSPAPASKAAYEACGAYASAQDTGTITFTAESVPTESITVNVLVLNL